MVARHLMGRLVTVMTICLGGGLVALTGPGIMAAGASGAARTSGAAPTSGPGGLRGPRYGRRPRSPPRW